MSNPKILVTGDFPVDYDLYLHSEAENPPPGTPPTSFRATFGGAGIAFKVLHGVWNASPPASRPDVRLLVSERPATAPTAAVWVPCGLGSLANGAAGQKAKVWRTRRSQSLGPVVSEPPTMPVPGPFAAEWAADPAAADLLVIQDDAAAFRSAVPPRLLAVLQSKESGRRAWVLLKTGLPIARGPLWWAAISNQEIAQRLIVVVPVSHLRRANVRISQGISWERTAEDLVRELTASPAFTSLRQARHVVVTLGNEGALCLSRNPERHDEVEAQLFFDPAHMEGEWAAGAGLEGEAYGYHAVCTAALAARLAANIASLEADSTVQLGAAVGTALRAMRVLRLLGHGFVDAAEPGVPAEALGKLLASENYGDFSGKLAAAVDWGRLGSYGRTAVPVGSAPMTTWRILESSARDGDHPLYGCARRVALKGSTALANVPYARFGGLFTADRHEIESLRNMKRLIESYARDGMDTKPLSLAVFGPPGAGKSFGIKQIAESVIQREKQAFLEFNLSQFGDPSDLVGAFHQVRDKVLENRLPVVFWDEFDSERYRWLQFLLAPMQDGKFQEGQVTHPLGRCVFVFAGATSYTYKDFGPPECAPDSAATDAKEYRNGVSDFKLKKGPDFKSRLHGYLDVLGPNQRQVLIGGEWADDPSDVCFPVRRAILLRAMLGLMKHETQTQPLEMDPGLLSVLLEIGHFRHGSRSFEKILLAVRQGSRGSYHRSALPTDEVLEMNLKESVQVEHLLGRSAVILPYVDLLAAAIHARWLSEATPGSTFLKEFEVLDAEERADNVAAALRIPDVLALAGLELVPSGGSGAPPQAVEEVLEEHMEVLAEAEHDGWMVFRLENGWRPCERVDDKEERQRQRRARLHDCLRPYSDLTTAVQDLDRGAIRWYPTAAALAGFQLDFIRRPKCGEMRQGEESIPVRVADPGY
jgi:hypothetical protein